MSRNSRLFFYSKYNFIRDKTFRTCSSPLCSRSSYHWSILPSFQTYLYLCFMFIPNKHYIYIVRCTVYPVHSYGTTVRRTRFPLDKIYRTLSMNFQRNWISGCQQTSTGDRCSNAKWTKNRLNL